MIERIIYTINNDILISFTLFYVNSKNSSLALSNNYFNMQLKKLKSIRVETIENKIELVPKWILKIINSELKDPKDFFVCNFSDYKFKKEKIEFVKENIKKEKYEAVQKKLMKPIEVMTLDLINLEVIYSEEYLDDYKKQIEFFIKKRHELEKNNIIYK